MRRVIIWGLISAFFAICPAGLLNGAEASSLSQPGPPFQEVYDLIRTHLPGVSEAELDRMAVDSLIAKLGPRVILVPAGNAALELVGGPFVKSSTVYDQTIAYLRISRVEEGLAQAVRETCQAMKSNKLDGVVLDLRYVRGENYAAAADTADVFLAKERPLLNWGTGLVRSKEKSDAITMPVAVLVNAQTARAAEALAAVLRETGAGLLIGANTAGQALLMQDYPLKNGQRLRIATASIQVGETVLLSSQGVKPDISIEVSPADERAYFADAYKELAKSGGSASSVSAGQSSATNRVRRPRFNEAELVRERREGVFIESDAAAAVDEEPETPFVRDPALARALDVLKGLAVVRRSRS